MNYIFVGEQTQFFFVILALYLTNLEDVVNKPKRNTVGVPLQCEIYLFILPGPTLYLSTFMKEECWPKGVVYRR